MNDQDYEKLILGDGVNPTRYEKMPKELVDKFQQVLDHWRLKDWQEKYSLEKLIK